MTEVVNLPLVSIITPSYNHAAYIRDTIKSVLTQDYPNIEHIVVDGGSADGTVEILREYGERYPNRFRWVSEPDKGQSDAFNKGLAMAHGELIGWQNSDDIYLPNAVRVLVQAFDANPEATVVYGSCYVLDQQGVVVGDTFAGPFVLASFLGHFSVPNQAALIRRSALQGIGGLDVSLHFCMDWDLWLRLYQQQGRFVFIPTKLAGFRIYADNKSTRLWSTYWRDKRALLRHFNATASLSDEDVDATRRALGEALIAAAVCDALENPNLSIVESIQEGLQLWPRAQEDVRLLAYTCLAAVVPIRSPLGRQMTRIIEAVSTVPHIPRTFTQTLLGYYFGSLALAYGKKGRRRYMFAYALRAVMYDRKWAMQRREITVGLLRIMLGQHAQRAALPLLRVARRVFAGR